jgi:hypothetical protein
MSNPNPVFLNLYQKRQATLLYHFSSTEFLDTITKRVLAWAAFTDRTLDYAQRVSRDQAMRKLGWTEAHLSSNWSTHAHPMLQDLLQGLFRDKALRATESYDISGVSSTMTGMDYVSMNWALPEEEKKFRELEDQASLVGDRLDSTILRRWNDFSMTWAWDQFCKEFARLPKFRVRSDVVTESGKRPIRTGVYVPQDDEFGTLQFAWTGDNRGMLAASDTLSDLAREYAKEVGRDRLWAVPRGVTPISGRPEITYQYFDDWCRTRKAMVFQNKISSRNPRAFIDRPCKWFYVEKIEGEFEEIDHLAESARQRIRCEPGSVVPKTGWWHSPAFQGKQALHYFEAGARFPDVKATEWGAVFWQYEPDRQA